MYRRVTANSISEIYGRGSVARNFQKVFDFQCGLLNKKHPPLLCLLVLSPQIQAVLNRDWINDRNAAVQEANYCLEALRAMSSTNKLAVKNERKDEAAAVVATIAGAGSGEGYDFLGLKESLRGDVNTAKDEVNKLLTTVHRDLALYHKKMDRK